MPNPVRYPNGVTTTDVTNPLGQFGMPDPTKWYVWFDDFDNFEADQWIITTTEAGAGDATEATASGNGGILVITNDAADNDLDFLQWSGDDASTAIETFKFIAGKKTIFKARFKVSDATQSDFVMGLQITDTTPIAVTDGVYWRKDDGDANLDFVVIKDSTATTATAASTCADDTYMTLAFYYDGKSGIEYYKDDVKLGTSVTTNLCDDEELTISFGIQNGEAVAKIMTIDYIFAATER
jgi:hypothetical protein